MSIITNIFGQNTQVSEEDKELDPDTVYTFVVDYYPNTDNSGAEALEIKLTSYVDYQFQGIQIINPSNLNLTFEKYDRELNIFEGETLHYKYTYENLDIASYFNSVDRISFKATNELTSENDGLYIIDIEGKPYAFNFNAETLAHESSFLMFQYKSYVHSNFDYFLSKVYETAKSFPTGKTYTDLPLKLNDVFKLYEYNSLTGKFDIQSTFGQIDDYVSFKFNIYNRGIMTHEDSMFGMIGTNGNGGVQWIK